MLNTGASRINHVQKLFIGWRLAFSAMEKSQPQIKGMRVGDLSNSTRVSRNIHHVVVVGISLVGVLGVVGIIRLISA